MEDNEKKVLVIGHAEAGKTSLVLRYTSDKFESAYKATMGVDFHLKVVDRGPERRKLDLQLWDIGGQDKESQLLRVYFRHAAGCVIVFDLANVNSFLRVKDWKEELDSKVTDNENNPIPTLLLGNKCDLSTHAVSDEMIEKFLQENKGRFIGFKKVSAKDNTNVDAAMQLLIDELNESDPLEHSDTIDIKDIRDIEGDSSSCPC